MASEPVMSESTQSFAAGEPVVGRVVGGRYELLEKLGEGGMGEVWVAKQSEPVKRKVALKLIKKGMDSRAVLQRFEQERQALAVMDHPNIAKVLDGGLAENGQPYFVMELVAGKPLTQFCDEARLTVKDRLDLFVPVCQAIQHAHQKGIVHRDLKPANILVGMVDGKPAPKVIDFGVAKAVTGKLTEDTLSTQFGAVVGTLEYMAPEQAGLTTADVDTRADVYSLGVILYELLTGLRPFDSQRLRKAALDEMLRIIREEEPPSLASRLSTDETLPSIAAVRSMEPARLVSLVKGELAWIVQRCLEKDRNRRYETANGVARDVQRYLADEPVEARPVGSGYRLKKFLRRHRGPVVAASLIALSLIGGIAGTTIGLVQADAARRAAEIEGRTADQKRIEEAEARRAEKAAKEQAQKRLAQIEKSNEILGAIFEDLDVRQSKRRDEPLETVLAKRLIKAAEQLQGEAVGDPLAVATLQDRLGISLVHLGWAAEALPMLKKARETRRMRLNDDDRHALASANNVALALHELGRATEAVTLHEEALHRRRATLGRDHPDTIVSLNNLAAACLQAGQPERSAALLEEALGHYRKRGGVASQGELGCMNNLALAWREAGRPERVIPLLEEAHRRMTLKFGANHRDTLSGLNNLGDAFRQTGNPERGIPLLEDSHRRMTSVLAADHPDTVSCLNNLGLAYQAAGRHVDAVKCLEDARRLREARFGPNHPAAIAALSNLGAAYLAAQRVSDSIAACEEAHKRVATSTAGDDLRADVSCSLGLAYGAVGRHAASLPHFEECVRIYTKKFGPVHSMTIKAKHFWGQALVNAGRSQDAVRLLEEVAKIKAERNGPHAHETLISLSNLSVVYRNLGRTRESLKLSEEVLPRMKARFGADHIETINAMGNLALDYQQTGNLEKALPLLEEIVAFRRRRQGPEHSETLVSLNNLALGYHRANKTNLALRNFLEAAIGVEKRRFEHPNAGQIMTNLSVFLERQNRLEEAEAWRRKWSAVVRSRDGAGSDAFAAELRLLGLNLLQQRKWNDAEANFREYLTVQATVNPPSWRTPDAKAALGAALLGKKKYADAEPLLLEGYNGLKQYEKTIPKTGGAEKRIPEALDRLIELYTATNKPDEVKKWQAERAKYPPKPSDPK